MKIIKQLKTLKNTIFFTKSEKKYIQNIQKLWKKYPYTEKSRNYILIQIPKDTFYLSLFSYIANYFHQKEDLTIRYYSVTPCFFEFKSTLKGRYLRFLSFFANRKWEKLYTASNGICVLNVKDRKFYLEKKLKKEAASIFTNLKTKSDVINLNYKNIILGDLVYDTYLRFKPSETINIRDPLLFKIILNSLHIYHNTIVLFKKKVPQKLITSNCTYIHHAIIVRIALKYNVETISMCMYNHLMISVKSTFPTHMKNYMEYPKVFSSFKTKEDFRNKARIELNMRFKGKNDIATYYMRKSAYGQFDNKQIFKKSKKKRALILLHCFFDSPHIYRNMLFPDFYEWINFTLEVASNTNFDFYVKPHPNGLAGNESIVNNLQIQYPKITFIPSEISNMNIINEGVDAVFTVYGTAGSEFPYFGIPVITAGDNPHMLYNFCLHSKTIAEYEYYLLNIDKISTNEKKNKQEIEEFYYMHMIHQGRGRISSTDMAQLYQFIGNPISSLEIDKLKFLPPNKVFSYIDKSYNQIKH